MTDQPTIIGIDPGPEISGAVWLYRDSVVAWPEIPNLDLYRRLRDINYAELPILAIEDFRLYDVRGDSCLKTIKWIGRFGLAGEENGWQIREIPRATIRSELCGRIRGIGDAQVAAAVRDWAKEKWDLPSSDRKDVVGTKRRQGPLYGVKKHAWAALAVAVVAKLRERRPAQ